MTGFLKKAAKLLLAVLLAGLFLWGGYRAMQHNFVYWNGVLISRTAEEADLAGKQAEDIEPLAELKNLRRLDARGSGLTPEQYEWLRERLPGCRILWEVPIDGRLYDQDTRAISVSALTEKEMDLLAYLPRLSCVDVGAWEDLEGIRTLRERYPDCNILYSVTLGGETWGSDAVSLVLSDPDPAELREKLPYFPNLQSLFLTGVLPQRTELDALMAENPDVLFLWHMEVLGTSVEREMEELDLSAVALDSTAQVRELLPYVPELKRLRLNSENLTCGELAELVREYPEIRFSFDVAIGGRIFSSDEAEIDLSNLSFSSVKEVEEALPCFPELGKVVMCNCGISDEEMDALNRRYENIRFVWSVDLAGVAYRTDAVHFTPNRWGLELTDENIAALRYCTDMVCVDIGHAKKVKSCDWAACMPNLKYLVLAETGISDISPLEGLENLVFLELFLSRVKDLSPLVSCTALEDLNLCYTHPDPTPLGQMPWLKRVWWTGHWKAKRDLPKLLPDTQLEFSSPSSTGKGWREGQHYYDMRDFIGMKYMTG